MEVRYFINGFQFLIFLFSAGQIASDLLTPARIALSMPLVNAFTHPLVAAPVLASHPLDLQDIPGLKVAHSGPPGVNVEVKLTDVNDDAVEAGGNPEGNLLVRGPPVGKQTGLEDYVHVAEAEEGWVPMEARASVLTSGAFLFI